MDRLAERVDYAQRAVGNLEQALTIVTPSALERDATIKRFELAFEAVWKAVKEWLWVQEGMDVASPKSVIRASRELGLLSIDAAKQALAMVDDRNLAVHTYNEHLAERIYSRIRGHAALLRSWLSKITNID